MKYAIMLILLSLILGVLVGITLQLHEVLNELVGICATTRGCTP